MITVTGASGHLGRLAVEALLERGVPAGQIVAAVRTPGKVADLAERGVQVRQADYSRPETLTAALADTEKLLLVSGSEVGQRVAQHENVIKAAAAAGVSLIAYTSILNADTTGVALAAEHKATEALLRDCGVPYVLLRDGWYFENYTANFGPALQFGVIMGSARDGLIAGASRADYAAAAAVVLTTEGHENKAYELGGDQPFTMTELAAELAKQSGKPVAYQDLPFEEYAKALVGFGLPEPFANILADGDLGVARGELNTDSGHLRSLIGRPTTPLADAVAAALKA